MIFGLSWSSLPYLFIISVLLNALFGFFLLRWAWRKTTRVRNVNEERENLFPAYRRHDTHKWKLKSLYLRAMTTAFPRFFIALSLTLLSCVVGLIFMIGQDRSKPLTGMRRKIITFFFTNISAMNCWLVGWTTQRTVIENFDYSEYLGKGYKINTRSTTVCLAPHQSFIDTLIGVKHYFPRYCVKAELEKIPGLRNVLDALSCIYIQRENQERRIQALQ